jgi:hypothetical protein
VRDDGWFFDTELLVLAERSGLRIHEVPVDWVDDPDSRVDLLATAVADLRGIARLARGLASGALPVATPRAQRTRDARGGAAWDLGLPRQLAWFALVGVASTLAYLPLYLLLRVALPAQAANTAANRRYTATPRTIQATRRAP